MELSRAENLSIVESTAARDLIIGLVILIILFVVVLFLIVSRQPSATPANVVPASPTIVKGTPPLKNTGAFVGVPMTVPWSNVNPPLNRPQNSFYKILSTSASASSTQTFNTMTFMNSDANTASQYPFYTVLVVPPSWPTSVNTFADKEAVQQSQDISPTTVENGILPDLKPNGSLNFYMSDIDLTGISQIAFGFQNQTNQSLYFVINKLTNAQFEVPPGKTAVFQSLSNFWTVLQFRLQNPGNLSPQAQLEWTGGIVPLAKGAQPLANVSTQEQARNVAAAEVEAIQSSRGSQQKALVSMSKNKRVVFKTSFKKRDWPS